ncbi:MAG: nucleoside phosphorylase [Rickettsiales bacterium]|nr:nucleoside phosphorylase [Rickettsiales bacterium]
MKKEFPILEFDSSREVKIDSRKIIAPIPNMPERCVLCFFAEAVEKLTQRYPSETVSQFTVAGGGICAKIHKVDFDGAQICLTPALVGGPLAAAQIDEISAMGCRKFLAIGSAGVLDKEISRGKLILPISALRDEGTSYHYAAPSRWIDADKRAVEAIEDYLTENEIPFAKGKTWTTDAFYRETNGLFASRKAEGCISVEMECASYLAAARYNGALFGQIFYGGDCLDGPEWDKREWTDYSREDRRYWMLEQAMKIVQRL